MSVGLGRGSSVGARRDAMRPAIDAPGSVGRVATSTMPANTMPAHAWSVCARQEDHRDWSEVGARAVLGSTRRVDGACRWAGWARSGRRSASRSRPIIVSPNLVDAVVEGPGVPSLELLLNRRGPLGRVLTSLGCSHDYLDVTPDVFEGLVEKFQLLSGIVAEVAAHQRQLVLRRSFQSKSVATYSPRRTSSSVASIAPSDFVVAADSSLCIRYRRLSSSDITVAHVSPALSSPCSRSRASFCWTQDRVCNRCAHAPRSTVVRRNPNDDGDQSFTAYLPLPGSSSSRMTCVLSTRAKRRLDTPLHGTSDGRPTKDRTAPASSVAYGHAVSAQV